METGLPELSEEDADLMARAAIEEARERARRHPAFLTLESSDRIVRRGPQVFAVFGTVAHELAEWSAVDPNGRKMAARPALVDGQAYLESPEEGRPGVLHFLWSARLGRWTTSFLHTGWLWTRELDVSNAEIADRIAGEVDRGENVLVPKPPGWA